MKRNELNLGDAIREFLEVNDLSDKYLETEIFQRWEELAGRAVNLKTKKVEYRQGLLKVYLNSSVLRNELSLRKTEFMDRLNDRLRNRPIKKIEIC